MEKAKQILPQNFVTVNGRTYFRLEDGRIAVDTTSNVIIDSSKEDTVELITLGSELKEMRFWKIGSKIYALTSSTYVDIPKDTTFVDLYNTIYYPDGVYVKYISSGNCGIIYVSETDVSIVISHESYYTDICFRNELFYADKIIGESHCHVIAKTEQLVLPSRRQILKDGILFYDDKKIFIDSEEFEIPNGIISVEFINNDDMTFVKVVNSEGIYYYTKEISYLLGPIQEHEIIFIGKKACYIHEITNGDIVNVIYIENKEGAYICQNLSCDKGITVYQVKKRDDELRFFATRDKALYLFKEKFILLIKDVDVDTFVFTKVNWWYKECSIIGLRKEKPVYWASYNDSNNKITDSCTLDIIDNGFENSTICRKRDEILIINEEGQIILSTTGENCYKRKTCFKNSWHKTLIYIVEKSNYEIELYDASGKKFDIV